MKKRAVLCVLEGTTSATDENRMATPMSKFPPISANAPEK